VTLDRNGKVRPERTKLAPNEISNNFWPTSESGVPPVRNLPIHDGWLGEEEAIEREIMSAEVL
jgi:hypothetical protein